ncbi:MAG: hypothetical protein QOI68_4249, partial [Pseudonocardiales bacterium]|nr:hypothetical protein [Pseudonocardiales bacterium]
RYSSSASSSRAHREPSGKLTSSTSDQGSRRVISRLRTSTPSASARTLARVRADADGVEVRNLLITRYLPWSEVLEVSFPDGARWARLELPDDEYLPVSAIQLVDGQRAVTAIGELRALHAAHNTAGSAPD